MKMITTNVYDRNLVEFNAGKRLIINQGGTSSSKTYSVLQLLICIALFSAKPLLISIVSESFPHIRRGCMRDFMAIMGDGFHNKNWNKSESIYDFGANRKIEFFSADQASKLRGGRRDILFLNEANNVSKEAFNELDVRTRIASIIDFNPVSEFWAHELQHEAFVGWIHSTYLDALQVLEKSVIDNIISRKTRDPNWWRVYGLGLVGQLEGLIHPAFTQCKNLPKNFDREIFGLDFGYSQDPAALVQLRIADTRLYGRELIYERGLTNQALCKRMDLLGIKRGHDIIIADCAEPKSIDEIHEYGFDIRPCAKGADSVRAGIQRVNQYEQMWTEDSLNAIKEQRNYQWERDKNGKATNKPIDDWDHIMSARRYAVATIPERKVLPVSVSEIPQKFTIDFDALSEHSSLVCSIWSAKKFKTSVSFMLWNSREARLWVFGELGLEHPRPDLVIVQSAKYLREITCGKILNLNKFQIWGSPNMHAGDTKDVASAYQQYNIWVQENDLYDEIGSALIVSRLMQRKTLRIHPRCEHTEIQCAGWTVDSGKPHAEDEYGFARALCNGAAACWEGSRHDPVPVALEPFSPESQNVREKLDYLIHANSDGFDSMSDEDIDMMELPSAAGTVDAGNGDHWL